MVRLENNNVVVCIVLNADAVRVREKAKKEHKEHPRWGMCDREACVTACVCGTQMSGVKCICTHCLSPATIMPFQPNDRSSSLGKIDFYSNEERAKKGGRIALSAKTHDEEYLCRMGF